MTGATPTVRQNCTKTMLQISPTPSISWRKNEFSLCAYSSHHFLAAQEMIPACLHSGLMLRKPSHVWIESTGLRTNFMQAHPY